MSACESARYPARTGSAPCASLLGASGTSLAALVLSPTAKKDERKGGGGREKKLKDEQDKKNDGDDRWEKWFFISKKIKVQFSRLLFFQNKSSCGFSSTSDLPLHDPSMPGHVVGKQQKGLTTTVGALIM